LSSLAEIPCSKMPETEHQVDAGEELVSQRERKEMSSEAMVRRVAGRKIAECSGVSLLWTLYMPKEQGRVGWWGRM
jgi:hypothetical protein